MKLIWEVYIPHEFNRERQVELNNLSVWVHLGPQDVPREAIVTRQAKNVRMELHYGVSQHEKWVTVEWDAIRVTTCRNSGRVIFIDCGKAPLDLHELRKPFQQLATSALARNPDQRPQRLLSHYELIAEDVLPYIIRQLEHELMLESR